MISVLILVFFVVMAVVGIFLYVKNGSTLGAIFNMISGFVGGVFLVGFIVCEIVSYSEYTENYASIDATKKQIVILKEKAGEMLPQFKYYLASFYPKYEKSIFNAITLDNYKTFLLKYPEIKTIEAIQTLIGKIDEQIGSIYSLRIQNEVYIKNIKSMHMNPFIIIPDYVSEKELSNVKK